MRQEVFYPTFFSFSLFLILRTVASARGHLRAMSIPLSFLRPPLTLQAGTSLGESISQRITGKVITLLDCLPSTAEPAIHSPDPTRRPLEHHELRTFVTNFALPHSTSRTRLAPQDRVMLVLPTGPENALALLAIANYHTCAPVNINCTAFELKEDARRLGVKAVVTVRDAEARLELQALQEELRCEIIYLTARSYGPAGVFDLSPIGNATSPPAARPRNPRTARSLLDQSLVLFTSGTSGRKKVVPYTLLSLLVGTWSVVQSWELAQADINSE